MTTISGNNVTYTGYQIWDSSNSVLTRIPTEDSNDTFEEATDILYAWIGYEGSDRIGETIQFKIKNGSEFIINVSAGNGMTMEDDSIPPKTTTSYILIKTSGTTVKLIKTSSGTEKDSVGTFLKDINVYGTIFDYKSVASISATEGVTYTTGQIFGSYIKRTCGANYTDTLPNAVNIVSAIKYPKIGTSFHCYIQNSSSSNKILTITGGSGTTISGTTTDILKNTTILLIFTVTNVGSGTEAVTCYIMGVLTSSSGGDAALITSVDTNTYTLLSSDNTINVDTNTIHALCVLTLPEISTIGQKRYFITDSTGKAGLYNIRVVPSGSDTIVGTSSVTINSNYSSISMYNDEVSNWILY
jgi:hypothetical protein